MTARKEKPNSTFLFVNLFCNISKHCFLIDQHSSFYQFLRADMTKKVTSKLDTFLFHVSTTFTQSEKAKI